MYGGINLLPNLRLRNNIFIPMMASTQQLYLQSIPYDDKNNRLKMWINSYYGYNVLDHNKFDSRELMVLTGHRPNTFKIREFQILISLVISLGSFGFTSIYSHTINWSTYVACRS